MALYAPIATATSTKNSITITMSLQAGSDAVSRWQHAISQDTSLSPSDIWAETTINPATFGNLATNVKYYYWGRYKNTAGAYSPWSAMGSIFTYDRPQKPLPPTISNVTQRSYDVSSTPKAGEPAPILEYKYSVWEDPERDGSYVHYGDFSYSTPAQSFVGWTPARAYAMSVSMRNQTGWSDQSDYTYFSTLAGAKVVHQGYWYKAVPYVMVDGTWRMAAPWARVGGAWKPSLE